MEEGGEELAESAAAAAPAPRETVCLGLQQSARKVGEKECGSGSEYSREN